jgi:hypothetical protein
MLSLIGQSRGLHEIDDWVDGVDPRQVRIGEELVLTIPQFVLLRADEVIQ